MLVLLWLCSPSSVLALPPQWGRKITRIDFKTDADLYPSQFEKQIVQKVGEPLDPAKVNQSLKNLYATGRFVDLEAEAEPGPGGVVLIFAGKARYFIGVVQVSGTPKSLESSTLVAAARLPLGRPLQQEDLTAAVQNIKGVLADNAFYRVKIQEKITRNPATQEANVLLIVSPGEQAHLNKVVFKGTPGYPDGRLRGVTNWHPGQHLTSAGIEKGLYKLHNFYLKHGYLQASTVIEKRVFDAKANSENLIIESNAGPVIEVHVEGAEISHRKLRDILPIYQDGVIDKPALQRGSDALRDFYQQKGYLQASVTVAPVKHLKANHLRVTYTVKKGRKGKFEGYEFAGNHALTTTLLSSAMTIHPAQFPFQRLAYSTKLLNNDVNALKTIYQSRGFLDAKVTPNLNYYYHDQPEHLFVTIQIEEGQRTMVGKLNLQGLSREQEKVLTSRLSNRPGHYYSPENEQRDRETILRYFANRGYSHARVLTRSSSEDKKHIINVEYQVEPGNKETIARVVLLGNEHTREDVVRRQLEFAAGQPMNESALLQSQRKLYDLGLFNQVQVAPQNPRSHETHKSVLVSMEETPRWAVGYGGGIEVQRLGSNEPQGQFKASPRVSLDVSRIDVGGRDQTASFRGRLSTLDKGAAISYFIPRLPRKPGISVRLSGDIDNSRNVLTFTAKRQEASIVLEKRWSKSTFLSARYSFRNVQALDLSNRISPNQIPLYSLPAKIGMYAMSYVNDHRDNPLDPTRGSYSVADAGISWSGLGSEANFLRFSAQNATYYRLTPHLVFARDTRFAVESPYGGLRQVTVTEPDGSKQTVLTHDIPLPERFFMGGANSDRAFSINQAGPRDPETGYPIGGNALFLNSLELRFSFAQNRLGFVIFHDMGNVYTSIRDMKIFKYTQNSPTDFNYTVQALGVGFLYKTPVGPLSFQVAYALNPTKFQVANSSAPGGVEVRQLSHVQYFLSIGQSF